MSDDPYHPDNAGNERDSTPVNQRSPGVDTNSDSSVNGRNLEHRRNRPKGPFSMAIMSRDTFERKLRDHQDRFESMECLKNMQEELNQSKMMLLELVPTSVVIWLFDEFDNYTIGRMFNAAMCANPWGYQGDPIPPTKHGWTDADKRINRFISTETAGPGGRPNITVRYLWFRVLRKVFTWQALRDAWCRSFGHDPDVLRARFKKCFGMNSLVGYDARALYNQWELMKFRGGNMVFNVEGRYIVPRMAQNAVLAPLPPVPVAGDVDVQLVVPPAVPADNHGLAEDTARADAPEGESAGNVKEESNDVENPSDVLQNNPEEDAEDIVAEVLKKEAEEQDTAEAVHDADVAPTDGLSKAPSVNSHDRQLLDEAEDAKLNFDRLCAEQEQAKAALKIKLEEDNAPKDDSTEKPGGAPPVVSVGTPNSASISPLATLLAYFDECDKKPKASEEKKGAKRNLEAAFAGEESPATYTHGDEDEANVPAPAPAPAPAEEVRMSDSVSYGNHWHECDCDKCMAEKAKQD